VAHVGEFEYHFTKAQFGMRQLQFLLSAPMIPLALFFFGCRSNNDIVSIQYKRGDRWVDSFRNSDFPSKSLYKDKVYCSSLFVGDGNRNRLYCLDLKTGKVDWASLVDDWAAQPPIVSDSFIYYCSYVGDKIITRIAHKIAGCQLIL
jgi:outer membrane protein assembly factor BamB